MICLVIKLWHLLHFHEFKPSQVGGGISVQVFKDSVKMAPHSGAKFGIGEGGARRHRKCILMIFWDYFVVNIKGHAQKQSLNILTDL